MDNPEIKPFRIAIPQTDLDDLRARLERTRYPEPLPDAGWSRGAPLDYVKELAGYWRTHYDWRRHERALNEYPQFTTDVDRMHLHFLHVRSKEPNALPLIISHGWPSSVVEFQRVLGPLTDPRAHGLDPSLAFHVVAPSLPGFGFSGSHVEIGWGVERVTAAYAELMRRLGYTRYAAHGGDFGRVVARQLGIDDREHVLGVHLNGAFATPTGEEAKSDDPEIRRSVKANEMYMHEQSAYGYLNSTRPQSIAYALTDSPVGHLAWIAEKFQMWTDCKDRPEDAVDRDQMLTNISVYWFTRTAGSSARLYVEGRDQWFKPETPSSTPTGVAVFPREISYPVRRIAERTNRIVHWREYDRGGHFPAMEQPELLVRDIRECMAKMMHGVSAHERATAS